MPSVQGLLYSRHGEQKRVAREDSKHVLQGMVGVPGMLLSGLLLGDCGNFQELVSPVWSLGLDELI